MLPLYFFIFHLEAVLTSCCVLPQYGLLWGNKGKAFPERFLTFSQKEQFPTGGPRGDVINCPEFYKLGRFLYNHLGYWSLLKTVSPGLPFSRGKVARAGQKFFPLAV